MLARIASKMTDAELIAVIIETADNETTYRAYAAHPWASEHASEGASEFGNSWATLADQEHAALLAYLDEFQARGEG